MLKAQKWKFDQTTINFLGVVVGNRQVLMDLEKTKAVHKWRTPCNLKESCSFMQFCNYHWTFIPNFAAVTVPLNGLTCKDTPRVSHGSGSQWVTQPMSQRGVGSGPGSWTQETQTDPSRDLFVV